MKKSTTLLAAILFTTGMVFAQGNSATVNQSGTTNGSNISQVGTSNDATVNQFNGYNDVILNQESDNGSSTANITQTVSGNATANRGHSVKLDQVGNNLANIVQNAAGNQVLNYTQDGPATQTSSTGALNTLTITQQTAWSEVFVDQTSGGNTATISQSGGNDFQASLFQNSVANISSIVQTGGGAIADVQQLDDGDHTALVNQGENFQDGAQFAYITQNGFDQTAMVTQYGSDNTTTINQSVLGNQATVMQDGTLNVTSIMQDGSSNTAMVTQSN